MPVRPYARIPLSSAAVLAVAGLAATSGVASVHGGSERSHSNRPERPNIILIRTDDQALRQFSTRTMPKTMRLLAGHGTTFTDSIVTTPLCCPSRATGLTGQYGHNNGVLANQPGYPALRDKRNVLPVWLHRAGYRTAHIGKYLNEYSETARNPAAVAPGWDEWVTALSGQGPRYYRYSLSRNGRRVNYGRQWADQLTRVLNHAALRLIRTYAPRGRPLYLQLDQRAPHRSIGVSRGRCNNHTPQPDPRDLGRFQHQPLPRPPSFNEADVSDKPSFIRRIPQLEGRVVAHMELFSQCARASLRAVDRGVAAIFHTLRKIGEQRSTVVMFTSDNGYYFGEHRLGTGKAPPYEESIRVPLLIRMPSPYRNGAARVPRSSKPVANIDLAPTILRLARARPCRSQKRCRTLDGRSLLPLLRGHAGRWPRHRALLVELRQPQGRSAGVCAYQGVRLGSQIFTEYTRVAAPDTGACEPADEHELYELAEDPYQLQNLADQQSHATEQQRLSDRLDQLRGCAGIAGRDRRVNGQPFCE